MPTQKSPTTKFNLLPTPKSLTPSPGTFTLPPELFIVLSPHPATRDLFAAERFALEAESLTNLPFHISVGHGVTPATEIRATFDPTLFPDLSPALRDQAYRLAITPEAIHISSFAAPGTFYAFQTLLQLLRESVFTHKNTSQKIKTRKSKIENSPFSLPCLVIEDSPDFIRRGFYHDTARGKVPTVDTLLQLIDDMGHLKYNEFQLYVENNFQFRKFPELYDDTDPLTAEDLLLLDSACRARHIHFVPSLTSLGHFEKILSRPKYRHLAEAEPAQLKAINATCWYEAAPWSLCVTDPAARDFLKDMYAEFAPNFSGNEFNICCDEAYDLGMVRSKDAAEKAGGTAHLYVEWIRFCNDLAHSHGKSIQLWGDIILNHPDLISQLPSPATLLEWGYEHDHKFDDHCATFAQRLGIKPATPSPVPPSPGVSSFYVAPGTTSWLSLSARTKNSFGNIHNAATAGLKHGATGLLLTDWGDNGHQQMLACSLTQLAYSAAASWHLAATPNPYHSSPDTVLPSISLHLFQDPTGTFASLAYDIGLTYERFSWQRFNASVDWYLFREKWNFANYVNRAEPKDLPKVIAACEKLIPQFETALLLHPDAEQIISEFLFTAEEIIHTCRRTALRQAWLAADPAKRNPEHETLRAKKPKPLPPTFKRDMRTLRTDVLKLNTRFQKLWLARNKKSRLNDVVVEFQRLANEYAQFAK